MTMSLMFTFKKTLTFCALACLFANSTAGIALEDSTAQQTAKDFTAVAKKDIPAVVTIQVKGKQKVTASDPSSDPFGDDFFQRFFGLPMEQNRNEQQFAGQASGFIVSEDGYIMTNSHVVQNTTDIHVILNDGREFTGKLVGTDPNTDVAIIKIDANELPYLEFGNSDNMEIGQWAIAIGNPFGLQATLTVGVISAKGRNNLDLTNVEDFIQTDAAINRGNSGGPLLDLEGKVIGMNTAIVSNAGTGGYMGIGFAIPSNMAKHIMTQLIKTGTVTRGFIGVSLQAVDHDLAQAFGLKQPAGAVIADVAKGSPAEKAGLKQNDIIESLNKQPIYNITALRNAISLMSPGTPVILSVLRQGKVLDISVEIGSYPTSTPREVLSNNFNKLGFEVKDIDPETAKQLGLKEEKGVIISNVEPSTPAAWAGLKKGTLIVAINQQQANTAEEFNSILQTAPSGKPVLLLVKQGELMRFISLKAEIIKKE